MPTSADRKGHIHDASCDGRVFTCSTPEHTHDHSCYSVATSYAYGHFPGQTYLSCIRSEHEHTGQNGSCYSNGYVCGY